MPAELLSEVKGLYEGGASYVYLTRGLEASHLLDSIRAADQGLLEEQRRTQEETLQNHDEVLP